jgi:translocator protein
MGADARLDERSTGRVEQRSDSSGRPWWPIALYLAAVAAVSVIGSFATQSSVDTWYRDLDKPWFTPPNWVFGPVWTAIYLLIAVSAFLTHRARRPAGPQLALWWVQLGLNLGWSLVFFGLESPIGGLVVIVPLLAAIVALIASVWPVRRIAALLLVPYALWVSYAAALNLAIALSN